MTKKIVESIERNCCQYRDLRPVCDSKVLFRSGLKNVYDIMQCKYCGDIHKYYRYMDAAGSMDWEYRNLGEK